MPNFTRTIALMGVILVSAAIGAPAIAQDQPASASSAAPKEPLPLPEVSRDSESGWVSKTLKADPAPQPAAAVTPTVEPAAATSEDDAIAIEPIDESASPEISVPPGPIHHCGECDEDCDDSHSGWCSRMKRRAQESYWGYPEEFHEMPLGYYINAHVTTQVANGERARMVLYQYDFIPGADQLKARGQQQLAKISELLPKNFFPLVIEPTGDPDLDQKRKQAVLRQLAEMPFPVPQERVIVADYRNIWKLPAGLSGIEAELISVNLLNQIQAGATGFGAAVGGATAGFGGGATTGAATTPAAF